MNNPRRAARIRYGPEKQRPTRQTILDIKAVRRQGRCGGDADERRVAPRGPSGTEAAAPPSRGGDSPVVRHPCLLPGRRQGPGEIRVAAAFEDKGMTGLLDERRGRKGPVKLTTEVLALLERLGPCPAAEAAAVIESELGVRLHPRSIQRARRG